MGAHHAPHSSSHAARLAGKGAFTAAAALALTGGTASLAFASEAPSVPTTHEIQGSLTDGAHHLQDAAKSSPLSQASHVSAHSMTASVTNHGTDLQHKAADAASTLKDKAPTSLPTELPTKLPTTLPASDMKTDAGHMVSNTENDVSHAATNWSGAMKDGLTPTEGAKQVTLMSNDVQHAVDNGKNDVTHWSGAASENAPELPSMLSFS
ncbi:hypothetical protein [Actinomycetospora sp.]|jgi:hypothetical protein|uniref:hypothetical protein n=1 Tax=Actinomycetospora sp. TaxID=1872135 RepID=UPI002F41F615